MPQKIIPSLVMSLLNVPLTSFPPVFSSPTASLTPLTASLTPLTGIRVNPCATLLWGWTIWSSDRSDPNTARDTCFGHCIQEPRVNGLVCLFQWIQWWRAKCGQNTWSHARVSQSCRAAHVRAHFTLTCTCVWLKA